VALSARGAHKRFEQGLIPLAGVAGAFIFAAQMINIPVPGGTSGHLMGGALMALLLGLAPAVLVMSAVLVIQCLIFQDGGLVALGANIVNMAIVAPVTGLGCFRAVQKILPEKMALAAGSAVAGWVSLEAGALLAGLQIGLSGTLPTVKAMAAMGSVHAIIGVLEGILTAVVVQMLHARRPDLLVGVNDRLQPGRPSGAGVDVTLVVGGVLSLILAAVVVHLASTAPDGLEHVLESSGVTEGAPWLSAPMPDYRFPWLRGWAGKSLAGLLGVLGAAGLVAFALRLARPASGAAEPDPSPDPPEER
jgi:cobalt/nickel transport system permease protein